QHPLTIGHRFRSLVPAPVLPHSGQFTDGRTASLRKAKRPDFEEFASTMAKAKKTTETTRETATKKPAKKAASVRAAAKSDEPKATSKLPKSTTSKTATAKASPKSKAAIGEKLD